ncbi:MAG: pilus assembly protein PilP, partial [Burkholderiales bacterium]|nr:pilus assembly protein PilP [Burkholderiales bacterium]
MMHRIAIAAFLLSVLTACGDGEDVAIKTWMEQVKKETPTRVAPVTEPKLFVPANYESGDLIDPFDSNKLTVVFARMKAANDNGLKPDFDRPKEALEGYPLETLTMVGTIDNKKVLHA